MNTPSYARPTLAGALVAGLLAAQPLLAATLYQQTNLVSDLPGVAARQNANLVNPWGLDFSATGPFWIANNGSATATVHGPDGAPFPTGSPLVVNVPGAPTGIVFNGTTSFQAGPGKPSAFLFASEDGTISGWNPSVDLTHAHVLADRSSANAIYKGITLGSVALGNIGTIPLLYATDFHNGSVDVFGADFTRLGSFTDPTVPQGFAPFNVQNIQGNLFVTFAMQDQDQEDDVAGPGNGFVDEFSPDGMLVRRFASQGTLDSPWGVALAPSSFGEFGGKLLIGNFGDGTINAYDPASGSFLGQLHDANGDILSIPGLWALKFGNDANAGDADTLFFTAGIPGPDSLEDHGLFGAIRPVPEPASFVLLLIGLPLLAWARRRRGAATLSGL